IRDRNVTGVQTCALPILMIQFSRNINNKHGPSFFHIFFHNPFPFLYSPPILKSVSLCTEKGAFLLWKAPLSQGFSYASVYFRLRSEERRVGTSVRSRRTR